MKSISEALLATLFPVACKICGQLIESKACGVACQDCWSSYLPFQPSQLCQKCGYPCLELNSPNLPPKNCAKCRKSPYCFAYACGPYEGAMQASILELKKSPYLCEKLSDLIKKTLQEINLSPITLIIPTPLHQERLKERTFNQAELIAEKISTFTNITLDTQSFARTKPTAKHRFGMDEKDREVSLKGAFEVLRPRLIENQSILLVDDVFTTGSTISAASKELLKAGAKDLQVFTLARVVTK